jgi:hypothetical protein
LDRGEAVGPFAALGEATGDGKGVAAVFNPEFKARVPGSPVLLLEFEFTPPEVDRSAPIFAALFSKDEGEVPRWLAFAFRFGAVLVEAFLLACDDEALLDEEFLLAKVDGAIREAVFEFRFAPLFDAEDCRPVFAVFEEELPPGTVKTTSRWFARCSTRAVEPGCRRNESTVLSPARCVFTSANPRPRSASARGTSAAGILT